MRFITLSLIAAISSVMMAQENTYLIKRENFKPFISSVRFSPDGTLLMAGFSDGSFRLMDPESLEVSLEVENAHTRAVNAMDMPPKMDFILTAGNNMIKLWDLTGGQVGLMKAHGTTIWNAEISNDGKYAVSSAFNRTFILWDLYNGTVLEQMRGHEDITLAVAISPDSRWIASGSSDQTLKVWDLETRQPVKTLHGPSQEVYDVDFSPDGRLLAVASKDRSVRIYDLASEQLLHLLQGHRDMVMEVAFSPDGRYLVSGSADWSVNLWDVSSGERIHTFLDHKDAVVDLVFHPDGTSFYAVSVNGDLSRWELHPEIFVLRYFEEEYRDALASDPIFEPRRSGESRKDFLAREEEAGRKKAVILEEFYSRYLER